VSAPRSLVCARCGTKFRSASADVLETLFVRHVCKDSLPIELKVRVIAQDISPAKAWRLAGRVA
jgi:hypothetical protein